MHLVKKSAIGAALALAGFSLFPAQAEDCKPLTGLVRVNLVSAPDKLLEYVPVAIQGTPRLMLLNTGGVYNEIAPGVVAELGLESHQGNTEIIDGEGHIEDQYTSAAFAMGRLKADAMAFLISGSAGDTVPGGNLKIAGSLAPDILKNYDIDIDFGANTLSVFSQDHCPGKVIYWPASVIAVIPMRVYGSGHIVVPVVLDGHQVTAVIDTGTSETTLTQRIAESQFDLKMGTADTPHSGALPTRETSLTYHHVFDSLVFEGIAVAHPQVEIIPDMQHGIMADASVAETGSRIRSTQAKENDASMVIGMNILRHFHLFISYKENKLYVTTADAPAPPPAAAQ